MILILNPIFFSGLCRNFPVFASIAECADAAGLAVVTGDTKVVPRDKADDLGR